MGKHAHSTQALNPSNLMRQSIVLFALLLFASNCYTPTVAESQLLPDPFPVYSHGTVVNHGGAGGKRGGLPTKNQFRGDTGGWFGI